MKFDINNYGINTAMHCSTEEQAITFCNHLHSLGKEWSSGKKYNEVTHFDIYEEAYYIFHEDVYSRRPLAYTILEFTDFEWDGYTPQPKTEPIKLRFTW